MKQKLRLYSFDVPLIRCEVVLLFCHSDTLAISWINETYGRNYHSAGNAIASCVHFGRNAVIWLGPDAKRSDLFHECWHCVCGLLEEIGSENTDEELTCHIAEVVFEESLKIWEKRK